MHMIKHRIVEDDSNRSPWETVRVCAKPINESWESCRTSPARRLLAIFCCVVCSWELPPSIRFRFTRKLECTGLCQRFMGKRLVVARKDISTPSISYLRNCRECLLELPKQWQLVYSTRFRHWRRMNPCTAARKTSGQGGSEMASSLLPFLADGDLQNTQKRNKQVADLAVAGHGCYY